ncbi:DNA polymerase Y family protein [Gordonia sp. ABSL11-1]|uniref:DNA polymerase Y family protein n=1 Tax=Gordonia sp. ABSL11-1 TaxID=3053924 RepID=UPI00257300A2|nr:DNA polymerase Y family protein [Gordonia sp. ABSL11-1]MDL9945888.1 DNA polymerase Y family protein [Gordonia sp. ABSL11-1]
MGAGRVLALWCPDWPATAAAIDGEIPPQHPIAVLHANRVVACSAPARRVGVRRGMRKRQAQSVCPEMTVVAADDHRDGRIFEPVVAVVADLVPVVEVLRPGVLVMPSTTATRHFGGEGVLAEKTIDAVAASGVEAQAGVADELFTAVLAARQGDHVEPGGDAAFLARRPVSDLALEPSLSGPDRADLVDLLRRLGISTIGAFADMSVRDVATRFSADAVVAHRLANALPGRPPSGQVAPADLVIEHECDPPIDRVDSAAFLGRRLADELAGRLAAASVACTRLTVEAVTERGQRHARTWRCAQPLTPEATADRIRWQLEGWLTGGRVGAQGRPDSPIGMLRLEPIEVVAAGALQYALNGNGLPEDPEVDERARRSLVRVQGLLGGDAVQLPISSGGRGPGERITMVSLGDERVPARDPGAPWPGGVPQPTPAVLVDTPIQVLDLTGRPVEVTGRGGFSAEPTTIRMERNGRDRGSWELRWWAGPWPTGVDTAADTTSGDAVVARAQVLLDDSRALLLRYRAQTWVVEGVYE